ncbi:MAG: HAD-IB family hydrolase [Acidimicrobiales bacterium]
MFEPSASASPVVAAFDLDGTLTEGGSVFRWLRAVAGTGRVYVATLALAVPLLVGALRSGPAADRAKERLFRRLLAGRAVDEVEEVSRAFILRHLERHLRPGTTARLRWHRAQGHDVVIVSASPELYVRVVAEEIGAQGALGTRLATDPLGRLTGGYLGRNCRGSEKLRRLDEWIAEQGYSDEPTLFAYGNSRGDRRMLRRARYAFNVGRLGRCGALRRFPTLRTDAPDVTM